MLNIFRIISLQSTILLINLSSGILITRTSNYQVRSSISALGAWLSFSLILFNQSRFERILRKEKVLTNREWIFRTTAFIFLSFLAISNLGIGFRIVPLVFAYLSLNTLVQFHGADILLNHGNAIYLRLNLAFYLLNLLQIFALIIVRKLDVVTWLIASLLADTFLLFLYLLFSKKSKIKTLKSQPWKEFSFSPAAIAAALVDSGIVIIANHFSEPKELSYFVVAISCISPLIILFSPLQNRILADPNQVLKQFSELNIFLVLPSFVVFSSAYYFAISVGVSRVFGDNYSSLADSALAIILMGFLFLAFKICNTLLRGLDLNLQSLSLSLILVTLFTILCNVIPQSPHSLILAVNFSLALVLLLFVLSQVTSHDIRAKLSS